MGQRMEKRKNKMKVLKEKDEIMYAIKWFARAGEEAEKSTCHRKR